jgi:hypothetical protein
MWDSPFAVVPTGESPLVCCSGQLDGRRMEDGFGVFQVIKRKVWYLAPQVVGS